MSTIPLSGIEAFLYAEARALDDRDWDTWLAFYASDASFWMPAWDDNDRLVEDPQAEISLIYYARRSGLEDRVFRIKTERSSASTPEPRTSHNISNVEILSQSDSKVELRFNWLTLSYLSTGLCRQIRSVLGDFSYHCAQPGRYRPLSADRFADWLTWENSFRR